MKKITLLLFVTITAFACTSEKKETMEVTPVVADISIEDGWARPGKAGMMSAAYFRLENTTDIADTLVSASSNVSNNTQIHLSYEKDGLMVMEEQEFVPVPANASVMFKQGGLHIMLIQPDNDINEGDSVAVELTFKSGRTLSAQVPVRPATGMKMDMQGH
tara:strand:- start:112983 stop:113465 length:483 start_codon:yes stop_codon:yes gene_type:complete